MFFFFPKVAFQQLLHNTRKIVLLSNTSDKFNSENRIFLGQISASFFENLQNHKKAFKTYLVKLLNLCEKLLICGIKPRSGATERSLIAKKSILYWSKINLEKSAYILMHFAVNFNQFPSACKINP
jgi:hypothetical protein